MRAPMGAPGEVRIPGDVILEPSELVLVATRPLFLWEPLLLLWLVLVAFALYGFGAADVAIASVALIALALHSLGLVVAWIPWRARWYVLTDRRVIARWGVFNRNQAAVLLDRIQDATIARPFPLSLLRDYGVLRLESAGEHSDEIISSGLRDLRMTGATRFYRALTDALTPGR